VSSAAADPLYLTSTFTVSSGDVSAKERRGFIVNIEVPQAVIAAADLSTLLRISET
jgi:hypothetical protein